MLVDLEGREGGGALGAADTSPRPRRRGMLLLLAAVPLAGALVLWLAPGAATGPLLIVGSASEVSVIDLATGEATVRLAGGVPSPDGAVVVAAHQDEVTTAVVALDAATGLQRWQAEVSGRQSVRLVGWGGDRVVLGQGEEDTGPYLPEARSETELTVITEAAEPRTYLVEGNLEAEALSRDGDSLFVVSYLPPLAPDRYQVRRLDLVSGDLVDVFTPDAHLQQAMGGTARTQVWAPDGTRLYTLYTLDEGDRSRIFVHVLALDELWAHCIELPDGIGSGGTLTPTLATSPDGERLYIADHAAGLIAQIDTDRLVVSSTAALPGGDTWSEDVAATATADGRVLVGSGGGRVHVLDAETLAPRTSWAVADGVAGLLDGGDGEVVAVMRGRRANVLDATSGERLRSIPLPGSGTIDTVVGASVRIRGPQEAFECAC